jgi:hypothetical protein
MRINGLRIVCLACMEVVRSFPPRGGANHVDESKTICGGCRPAMDIEEV